MAGEAAGSLFDALGIDTEVFVHLDRPGKQVDELWVWEEAVEGLKELHISNIRGDITVDRGSEGKVEIQAQKIVRAETEEKPPP